MTSSLFQLRYGGLLIFTFTYFSGRMRGIYTVDDLAVIAPKADK